MIWWMMYLQKIKLSGAQEIMEVQQEISYEKNQEKVGKIFKVIIDKKRSRPVPGQDRV